MRTVPQVRPVLRCGGGVAAVLALVVVAATGPAVADPQGTGGADDLDGNRQANVIRGLGGNDDINGRGGADRLLGGRGGDQVYSSRADGEVARFAGGPGPDVVIGSGNDQVLGGAGDDELFFTSGVDGSVLDCGPGRDVARVDTFTRQRTEIRGCERVRQTGTRSR